MRDLFEKNSQNYYEILDIAPDATQSDIRQAYFRAKAAYGKDSNAIYSLFDVQETKALLEKVEEAYLVLSNSDRRKEYDKTHGFIRYTDAIQTSKPQQAKHSFSFGKSESRPSSNNPAEEAAAVVFGSSNSTEKHEPFFTNNPAPATTTASSNSGMPSAAFANVKSQNKDPMSEFQHNSGAEKLGIVRRAELARPYTTDPTMEDAIKSETQFRGDFLRKVREYKGISLDEMCEFTKISKSYLGCLEAEEFESLPAAAYVRGFIIQIAKALKLPHDPVANGYMNNYKLVTQAKRG